MHLKMLYFDILSALIEILTFLSPIVGFPKNKGRHVDLETTFLLKRLHFFALIIFLFEENFNTSKRFYSCMLL